MTDELMAVLVAFFDTVDASDHMDWPPDVAAAYWRLRRLVESLPAAVAEPKEAA